MTLEGFFDSRLKFDGSSTYTTDGIRGYLAQQLVNEQCGYNFHTAIIAADKYLMDLIQKGFALKSN